VGQSCGVLGRIDLLLQPEEGTDKVEKAQEVSGQLIKTKKRDVGTALTGEKSMQSNAFLPCFFYSFEKE
jgi:hypothetical protein